MGTHMHTHSHIHTCTLALTGTTQTPPHVHSHMIHTHAHACTQKCTHIHARICAHVHYHALMDTLHTQKGTHPPNSQQHTQEHVFSQCTHTCDRLTCDLHRLTCMHRGTQLMGTLVHALTRPPPAAFTQHREVATRLDLRQQSVALTSDPACLWGPPRCGRVMDFYSWRTSL